MKKLAKGLAALIICGAFMGLNFENVQAAELSTSSVETQEFARHHHNYPPPPPPRHHDRHGHNLRHYHDDWGFNPPPPPPHDRHRHQHRW